MCEILLNILRPKLGNVAYKNFYFFSTKVLPEKPKTPDTTAREALQKILKINAFEALKLLSAHRKLSILHSDLLKNNYKICKQNRLSKKSIRNYPCVLSERNLDSKIDKLKLLPLNLNVSLPLVQLPQKTLSLVKMNINDFMNKLKSFSTTFELPLDKTCEIFSKRLFLISKSSKEIKDILNLYYEHGFTKEDILKDLWILKYSNDFIINRLKFIQNQEKCVMKTWMLRCPEDTLIKHIRRQSENRVILGENSLVQYLSKKLHCGEANAKSLIRKHPQLQHKSLSKMNLMIDLLCKQGFNEDQIFDSSREPTLPGPIYHSGILLPVWTIELLFLVLGTFQLRPK
ncbi:unnamed protein product [Ceutorhynchus assimilis]|uniref:Uncharacterized protein n=1 Tax=Ceutorhynchus assimilis TaxID=467358 RepID=A0A9P0DJS9_9CUCU|nr:unnamed protein product [Ceutorhynchus assimilis]